MSSCINKGGKKEIRELKLWLLCWGCWWWRTVYHCFCGRFLLEFQVNCKNEYKKRPAWSLVLDPQTQSTTFYWHSRRLNHFLLPLHKLKVEISWINTTSGQKHIVLPQYSCVVAAENTILTYGIITFKVDMNISVSKALPHLATLRFIRSHVSGFMHLLFCFAFHQPLIKKNGLSGVWCWAGRVQAVFSVITENRCLLPYKSSETEPETVNSLPIKQKQWGD